MRSRTGRAAAGFSSGSSDQRAWTASNRAMPAAAGLSRPSTSCTQLGLTEYCIAATAVSPPCRCSSDATASGSTQPVPGRGDDGDDLAVPGPCPVELGDDLLGERVQIHVGEVVRHRGGTPVDPDRLEGRAAGERLDLLPGRSARGEAAAFVAEVLPPLERLGRPRAFRHGRLDHARAALDVSGEEARGDPVEDQLVERARDDHHRDRHDGDEADDGGDRARHPPAQHPRQGCDAGAQPASGEQEQHEQQERKEQARDHVRPVRRCQTPQLGQAALCRRAPGQRDDRDDDEHAPDDLARPRVPGRREHPRQPQHAEQPTGEHSSGVADEQRETGHGALVHPAARHERGLCRGCEGQRADDDPGQRQASDEPAQPSPHTPPPPIPGALPAHPRGSSGGLRGPFRRGGGARHAELGRTCLTSRPCSSP